MADFEPNMGHAAEREAARLELDNQRLRTALERIGAIAQDPPARVAVVPYLMSVVKAVRVATRDALGEVRR
jgi:hypothetical protein